MDQRLLVMLAFMGSILETGGVVQSWFAYNVNVIGIEFYATGIDFATMEQFSVLEYTYMPWIILACGGTSAILLLATLLPTIRGKYRPMYLIPILLSVIAMICAAIVVNYFGDLSEEALAMFKNISFDENRGLWIAIAGGAITIIGSVLCLIDKDPPRIEFL